MGDNGMRAKLPKITKEENEMLENMPLYPTGESIPVDCEVSLQKCWQKEKPDYACIFVTKHNSEYNIWRFAWEQGEPTDEDIKNLKEGEEETRFYYLAWLTQDGDEWDDISECDFDEYLILEKLPTMEEVHKQWVESLRNT
jgi:hypothetical protein